MPPIQVPLKPIMEPSMNISEQTQRDLETILETLDQRIHELTKGTAERSASAAHEERHLLCGLRKEVAVLTQ